MHVIHRNGRIDGGPIAGTLGGPHKRELPHDVSFQLDMPAAGEFSVVRLGTVSSRARLQIRVDDRLAARRAAQDRPAGPGPVEGVDLLPAMEDLAVGLRPRLHREGARRKTRGDDRQRRRRLGEPAWRPGQRIPEQPISARPRDGRAVAQCVARLAPGQEEHVEGGAATRFRRRRWPASG